jgi:hypothetical protein
MRKTVTFCILWVVVASGAAFADEGKNESGQKGNRASSSERHRDKGGPSLNLHGRVEIPLGQRHPAGNDDSYFQQHGYTRLEIPKGHYPAPGECRLWYPDRPAGNQPPPGDCRRLGARVPPGAWLITRPEADRRHVRVNVYEETTPNRIRVTGEFDIGTGGFVRVVF